MLSLIWAVPDVALEEGPMFSQGSATQIIYCEIFIAQIALECICNNPYYLLFIVK